ncbi:acyl carrier protein [Streptomyces albus subsp. chlorinus]|uniref:acyl carrier protein n=1 Tax=Streptomyces albus TaxID=1888 RepID=UPI001570D6EC|nr:acyl carrier protein [Streptomyces albus]NSC21569.1 acyl carrier protein [Streptomyces albus subsp. chlorinus]
MAAFTLQDLQRLTAVANDEDYLKDITEEGLDVELADLGFDSLALLDLIGRVQREYEVDLPDDAVGTMKTPRDFLDFVNDRISESAEA